MALSGSQQVAVLVAALLFSFLLLPRMFGAGREKAAAQPHYGRKAGPGPGTGRGQPLSLGPGATPPAGDSRKQMKMMMEQEMKNNRFQTSSNKGMVFTLMPLYALGVGVFAAYKFMKIKSSDEAEQQKNKREKRGSRSAEAEKQLEELEQRLAQTEKTLNSILGQLDPLTSCVASVAQEQKKEIMSQLQTIRLLMKKRGMECPPFSSQDASCEGNLDDLIETLATREAVAVATNAPLVDGRGHDDEAERPRDDENDHGHEEERGCGREPREEVEGGEMTEEEALGSEEEKEKEEEKCKIEDLGAVEELPVCGLRRRNLPE